MKFVLFLIPCVASLALASCNKDSADDSASDRTKSGSKPAATSPTPDSLLSEILVEMEGFVEAMNSVTDVPTAEQAVAEMKTHTDATLLIAKEMEKLPVPSESEKEELGERWQEFEKNMKSMPRPDPTKIKDPQKVRRIMRVGMQSAGKTMESADAILRKYGIQLTHSK